MELTESGQKLKKQIEFLSKLSNDELNIAALGIDEDLTLILKKGLCHKQGWKETLSDDLDTLKYRESETGKFYETDNILEYLGDCRKRQRFDCTKDIQDFELIHRDSRQHVFFVAAAAFQEQLPETIELMKKWITRETKEEPVISTGVFEKLLVIMFENITVNNFQQKVDFLSKMQRALPIGIKDILTGYLARDDVDMYEELPSITNSKYETDATVDMIASEYLPSYEIVERIKALTPSLTKGTGVVNININIIINGNVNVGGEKSTYEEFIEYILEKRPKWYVSNKWISKQFLTDRYNEMNETNISIRTLMRNLRKDGMFDKISKGERRVRKDGTRSLMFQAK